MLLAAAYKPCGGGHEGQHAQMLQAGSSAQVAWLVLHA